MRGKDKHLFFRFLVRIRMEKGKDTIEGDKLSANHTSRLAGERKEKKLMKSMKCSLNKCSQNGKDAKLHKTHMSE